jgi:hypothetical protein
MKYAQAIGISPVVVLLFVGGYFVAPISYKMPGQVD